MDTKKFDKDFFNKMIDDKKAIDNCIRKGESLDKIRRERNVKFAKPI